MGINSITEISEEGAPPFELPHAPYSSCHTKSIVGSSVFRGFKICSQEDPSVTKGDGRLPASIDRLSLLSHCIHKPKGPEIITERVPNFCLFV